MANYDDQIEILSKLFPSVEVKDAKEYEMVGITLTRTDLIAGECQILVYRLGDYSGQEEELNTWNVDVMVNNTVVIHEFEGFISALQFVGQVLGIK